jgi:hypothetical protein
MNNLFIYKEIGLPEQVAIGLRVLSETGLRWKITYLWEKTQNER